MSALLHRLNKIKKKKKERKKKKKKKAKLFVQLQVLDKFHENWHHNKPDSCTVGWGKNNALVAAAMLEKTKFHCT